MFLLLFSCIFVGTVLSRPESNILLNLTFPAEALTEKNIEDWISYIKIVRDPSTTKEQKLSKIQELVKNETAEEKKNALALSEPFIDLNDWINNQIKNASAKVKVVFNKYFELFSDNTFWKKTNSEKVAQLEAVVDNLNDEEKKELEKIGEANLKKAKELGILDLIANDQRRRRG